MLEYNAEESCVFNKVKEKWGQFSNMGNEMGVVVNGIRIRNTEALYQACRFPDYPEIQKEIIDSHSGMSAKMISKKYRKTHTRSDWEYVKYDIMRYCVELKLYQNWGHLKKIILETGDRPIVELSHKDQYWGVVLKSDKLIGWNVLGNIWNDIKKNLDWYKVKPYHAISNFKLYGNDIGENVADKIENELLVNPNLDGYIIEKLSWRHIKVKLSLEFLKNNVSRLPKYFLREMLIHGLEDESLYLVRKEYYGDVIDELYSDPILLELNEKYKEEGDIPCYI